MFGRNKHLSPIEITSLVILSLTGIFLIGLQLKPWAWLLWLLGLGTLLLGRKTFAKDLALIYASIAILGITPITTDVSYNHMIEMGITLGLAVLLPYLISRYVYKDHLVRFKFHHGRKWYKKEVAYIFITAILAYFILPFYLKSTGAYLNWTALPEFSHTLRLFIGTNALGIWDELFFISTVLGILRRFLSFHWANLTQSILFTSFLYELGFTGWGFIVIFLFAIIQGLVFKKTESLFYVITIHLTLDLILFLVLVNLHIPNWFNFFVT